MNKDTKIIPATIERDGEIYVHVSDILTEKEINGKLQQELDKYKNIVDELKKEKSKKYDYVREVRTFNNNISKKDLEKFPVLKKYQGKDISYIVYESIDIL